jgi:hypothetical protein
MLEDAGEQISLFQFETEFHWFRRAHRLRVERCLCPLSQRKSPRCRFLALLSLHQLPLPVVAALALLLMTATTTLHTSHLVNQRHPQTNRACNQCVKSLQLYLALFHASLLLASYRPHRHLPTLSSCARSILVSLLSSSTLQLCQVRSHHH